MAISSTDNKISRFSSFSSTRSDLPVDPHEVEGTETELPLPEDSTPIPPEIKLRTAAASALGPVMMNSSLSMSQIFQKVQDSFQKMAVTVKDMSTQLASKAVELREKVLSQQLQAAEKEKATALKAALIGAGVSVGVAAGSVALQTRGKSKQEDRAAADFKANHQNQFKSEQDLEAAARQHGAAQSYVSRGSTMLGQLGGQATPIAEAALAGERLEIESDRKNAEYTRGVQDQLSRSSDQSESEYQDYRRKALDSTQVLVNLKAQEQQSASWRG